MIEKLFFIGIDVHKKTCVATIKGRSKKALLQTSFDNDATRIKGFIETVRRGGYHAGITVHAAQDMKKHARITDQIPTVPKTPPNA